MSRKTPFQLPHALEFGLLISGRDTKSLVTSVMCRFYIVAQLFFRPDDDLDMLSLEKSMALFKKVPDTTTSYCITIRNLKRFELALDHTSIGLSFRQTSAVIDQHKEAFGNAKLVGLNDHIVSQYVCVGVAINLQHISDILSSPRIWSFALAADSSTHRSVSYLDIRICVCPNGSLENLHLIAVPFYDRHTAENIAAMICHILDALYARWRSKIIAFSTDGENTMTGRHACVVTRIDHECETKLMRIWCAPHQIDLVVKDVSHSLNDGLFYKIAHDFSVHLRHQQNLQLEMAVRALKILIDGSILSACYPGCSNIAVNC
ncbi:unnamed protein product [Sphagnum balticum]